MGVRGAVVALALLVATVSMILVVPRHATAVDPLITDIAWTPRVPARGENATVYANISSPNGIALATAQWCILPLGTCRVFAMADADGDGRWNTTQGIPVVSWEPFATTGADFNVSAQDSFGNITYSPFMYVQFGDGIQVTATLNRTSVAPGGSVSLDGVAKYLYKNSAGQLQVNDSTPAWSSAVSVRIVETGTTVTSRTDGSGLIATTFAAPGVEGSYTVNVTVSNRTLQGSTERNLVVATVPAPDLVVVQGSLAVSPAAPKAGDTVTISFTVGNRGNAAATGFTVRLTVSSASAEVFRHDFTGVTLAPTENTTLSTPWTAVEGSMTLNVTIDPDRALAELSRANNYATQALTVESGLSITLIAGLTFLVVGTVVAVALILRRRRGRPKAPQ